MRDGDVWDKLVELFSWFQNLDRVGDKDDGKHLDKFVAENKTMKMQSEDDNKVMTHPYNPEHLISSNITVTQQSIASSPMIWL